MAITETQTSTQNTPTTESSVPHEPSADERAGGAPVTEVKHHKRFNFLGMQFGPDETSTEPKPLVDTKPSEVVDAAKLDQPDTQSAEKPAETTSEEPAISQEAPIDAPAPETNLGSSEPTVEPVAVGGTDQPQEDSPITPETPAESSTVPEAESIETPSGEEVANDTATSEPEQVDQPSRGGLYVTEEVSEGATPVDEATTDATTQTETTADNNAESADAATQSPWSEPAATTYAEHVAEEQPEAGTETPVESSTPEPDTENTQSWGGVNETQPESPETSSPTSEAEESEQHDSEISHDSEETAGPIEATDPIDDTATTEDSGDLHKSLDDMKTKSRDELESLAGQGDPLAKQALDELDVSAGAETFLNPSEDKKDDESDDASKQEVDAEVAGKLDDFGGTDAEAGKDTVDGQSDEHDEQHEDDDTNNGDKLGYQVVGSSATPDDESNASGEKTETETNNENSETTPESKAIEMTPQQAFVEAGKFYETMSEKFGLKPGDEIFEELNLQVDQLGPILEQIENPLHEELTDTIVDAFGEHEVELTDEEKAKFDEITAAIESRVVDTAVVAAANKIIGLKKDDRELVG